MRRFLIDWAVFLFIGCASFSTPKTFLLTDTKATSAWLNEFVDVDLQNVPLSELARRGPFKALAWTLTGVDGEALISLTANHVTRRQALWLLAEKYGLAMALADRDGQPAAIQVTNRETRPAPVPLK